MRNNQYQEPINSSNAPAHAMASKRNSWTPKLIWIVPIVAALIGIWMAINAINTKGPTIKIIFQNVEGLEVGKSKIKFKDVEIGEVSAISIAADRKTIVVTAEMKKNAESYLVTDSRFWITRPRISGGMATGLGTMLSGSYIGMDVGSSNQAHTDFIGLEIQPLIQSDFPGKTIRLRSDNLGSLSIGSPVYFRRIPVGEIIAYELEPGGHSVVVSAFINAPYDQHINSNTRYWHASGIDVTIDANGLNLNTQSLTSIAMGGIAFESILSDTTAKKIDDQTVLSLAETREKALANIDKETQALRLKFPQSIKGLQIGANVDFRGVNLGEVTNIGIEYDAKSNDFIMLVDIHTHTNRLNALGRGKKISSYMSLRSLIQKGLRAQLRSSNLLTGQLYVAIDFFPNAPAVTLLGKNEPTELPTIPGEFQELRQDVQRIVTNLEKVPFESIGTALEQSLKADAPLQQDIRKAANDISDMAQSFKSLADYLDRHPESLIRGKGDSR